MKLATLLLLAYLAVTVPALSWKWSTAFGSFKATWAKRTGNGKLRQMVTGCVRAISGEPSDQFGCFTDVTTTLVASVGSIVAGGMSGTIMEFKRDGSGPVWNSNATVARLNKIGLSNVHYDVPATGALLAAVRVQGKLSNLDYAHEYNGSHGVVTLRSLNQFKRCDPSDVCCSPLGNYRLGPHRGLKVSYQRHANERAASKWQQADLRNGLWNMAYAIAASDYQGDSITVSHCDRSKNRTTLSATLSAETGEFTNDWEASAESQPC